MRAAWLLGCVRTQRAAPASSPLGPAATRLPGRASSEHRPQDGCWSSVQEEEPVMYASRMSLRAGVAAILLAGSTACVTDPDTGERRLSRTAIGAGVG